MSWIDEAVQTAREMMLLVEEIAVEKPTPENQAAVVRFREYLRVLEECAAEYHELTA